MEEQPELQVIGKLEPIDCDIIEDEDTVDVKNVNVYPEEIQINHLQVVNTDGNLHIDTYQIQEEIVEDCDYDPGERQHVILTDGGAFIQDAAEYIHGDTVQYASEEQYEDVEEEDEEYVIQSEDVEYSEDADYDDSNYTQEHYEQDTDMDPDDPEDDIDTKLEDGEIIKDDENPCTTCDKIFKTTASLKRHIAVIHAIEENVNDDPLAFELCPCCGEPSDSAHSSGDIKCDSCDKLFVLMSNLDRHKSLDHCNAEGLYKCCDCIRSFPDKESILKHMQSHPLAKPFSCKVCNRDFTRKYHLDRHVAQTGCDGQPRNQFKCQVCEKCFSRKDNLRDHLRAHAGQIKKKKIFPCSYCNKELQGSALLSVHLRTHTGEKPYACDLCPKKFPSSGAMKKHRRMHTGEKPYQCMQCKRRFAAKETLNRHMRIHTGDKPHKCTYCGKCFIQAAQLRAHIFHHTGENAFTCPHCSRAFNRRVRLTTHIKFVHDGAQPMECAQCNKSFFRREDLQRHEALHSGDRPFECDMCQKKFAVKASLKLHALTHRKEQPCSCDECGRAFIRQDCLMRHMRSKHRDVLEDIMAGAEKRRLQQQLLTAASDAASGAKETNVTESHIWNELTLTDSIKELLGLLVDENTLKAFGWPDAPVDKILDSVIRRCGHEPASDEDFDYISRMRENAKLLFTVVIDDQAVKSLLNNQTVDEVIQHVLRLAKSE